MHLLFVGGLGNTRQPLPSKQQCGEPAVGEPEGASTVLTRQEQDAQVERPEAIEAGGGAKNRNGCVGSNKIQCMFYRSQVECSLPGGLLGDLDRFGSSMASIEDLSGDMVPDPVGDGMDWWSLLYILYTIYYILYTI